MNGLIDVHAHFCPGEFPEDPAGGATRRWPCMQGNAPGSRTIAFDGKPFRELDARSWDAARRIADMDADGVEMQALSPMPELLSYWLDGSAYDVISDHVNGAIAEIVAAHPTRFHGLGMVPMQNPAAAARALSDIRDKYGLAGVEIGSNINGVLLGDSRFDEFYAAAEELGLAVFVHALHPVATADLGLGPMFDAMAGFPTDTAMSITHMLMNNVPLRFPGLRIGFSHAGGTILPMLHRLDNGWHASEGFGGKVEALPSESARCLFYDSLVYDANYLAHFIETVGPGRTFVGTDYPYLIMQKKPADFVAALPGGAERQADVASGAARAFLGLD